MVAEEPAEQASRSPPLRSRRHEAPSRTPHHSLYSTSVTTAVSFDDDDLVPMYSSES